MEEVDAHHFLNRLLAAYSASDVRTALFDVGDFDNATLDSVFGPHSLKWKAFGNNPSNVSTIGLGSKPGKSLTERITNAMDAVLERRNQAGTSQQQSPRHAAHSWFGRPMSQADTGLFSWKAEPPEFDRQIHVVVHSSDCSGSPTIDVLDHGVGLTAPELPNTILSLQAGNKIRKRYQIGAFGQGGSATLGFCSYAIIVSRSVNEPSRVAFTVIRVLRLDASYKEDSFAYLVHGNGDSDSILAVEVNEATEFPLPFPDDAKIPPLFHGTLVRHVAYRLTNLDKSFHASPGNLYHFLHYSLFDPLIPFRVVDTRLASGSRNERVSGARNRLLSRWAQQTSKHSIEDANIQIKHYRPMEYIAPEGYEASIGVEYWVILGFRKKGDEYELRGSSNELFVQPGHPIVGTLNGQSQGDLTAHFLKQIGYSLLSRHMIVHIDATDADSTVRRELFATSREGFKEGPVLDSIMRMVRKILEEDERLGELEKELTERITKKQSDSAKAEVKQALSKLLRDAGFSVRDPGVVSGEGKGKHDQTPREKDRKPVNSLPLPTLPYPQVTRFEIVYPLHVCQIPLNETQTVVVETDADFQFNKFVQIRSEPPLLEIASRAPLRGGRVRWRMRASATAIVGGSGELVATLTRPDGSQLSSRVLFELTAPTEKQTRRKEGQIPPFDVRPVSPENGELWSNLWPDAQGDEAEESTHAYKVLNSAGEVMDYFSTIFSPLVAAVEALKVKAPQSLPSFETQYQIWIGYHAILQLQSQRESGSFDGVNDEVVEQLQELERQTVGRVQVRQALKTVELLTDIAKNAEPS